MGKQTWSAERVAKMALLAAENWTVEAISVELGVTPNAVRLKAGKEGILVSSHPIDRKKVNAHDTLYQRLAQRKAPICQDCEAARLSYDKPTASKQCPAMKMLGRWDWPCHQTAAAE